MPCAFSKMMRWTMVGSDNRYYREVEVHMIT
jgi:hypothetical protein